MTVTKFILSKYLPRSIHTWYILLVCVCVCLIHTERGTFEQIDNENQKPHKIKIVTSFIPESL